MNCRLNFQMKRHSTRNVHKATNCFFRVISTLLFWTCCTYTSFSVRSQQTSYKEQLLQTEFSPIRVSTCPDGSQCFPMSECSINIISNFEQLSPCQLQLENIDQGICCLAAPSASSTLTAVRLPALQDEFNKLSVRSNIPKVSIVKLRNAELEARTVIENVRSIEDEIDRRFAQGSIDGAERSHSIFFGNSRIANQLAHRGELLINMALSLISDSEEDDNATGRSVFSIASISGFIPTQSFNDCPKEIFCHSSRYRTADGSCTNLQKKFSIWATSMSPFERVLRPDYADGLNKPRVAASKNSLPNARLLSTSLSPFVQKAPAANGFTLALMQFGQFIDHDLTQTALTQTENGQPLTTCCDQQLRQHPACFPIVIPNNDLFYESRRTCMNFVRSAAATRLHCQLGPREQINQVTAVLDASMVYGNSLAAQKSLREFENGKLITSSTKAGKKLLPNAVNGTCSRFGNMDKCFKSGDNRVNENIHLSVLQTLFMRMHNSIVEQLSQLNPSWSDETLFQEGRRIVGALVQHFVYNEFLPSVLGYSMVMKFGLAPLRQGYFEGYNENVNPSIFSGFSTAAFRFHSMIQGNLELIDNNLQLFGQISLSDTFNNPALLRSPGMLDALINGMTTQAMQQMDNLFTQQIQNHLFRPPNSTFGGLDLVALNIQRGRDHGIPSYNRWRKACHLPTINSFQALASVMPSEVARVISQHYENVNDVDLFVAGVAEYHLPNALIGPSFGCIVAEQFRRLKIGDRFFYENGNQETSFTQAQLKAIRRMTIARVYCDYGDQVAYMQPYAFLRPIHWWNKKVPCNGDLIPKLNLSPWSERLPFSAHSNNLSG